MPVHPVTHAPITAAAASSARSQVTHKAHAHKFAGALAQASTKSSANTPDSVLDSKKVPKGEKTTPVEGHAYADITAGPRNGMFINTSGNKRDGQAFVLVKRDGKEFHVYGSGNDRLVVCLKRKEDADETASPQAKTKTETQQTAPSGTTGSS
jgi:hypothetical protein